VKARGGRDIDDGSVLPGVGGNTEVGCGLADEAERRADVDLLNDIPSIVGGCVQHLVKGEPCVVHDVVDLAILPSAGKQRNTSFGDDLLDRCVYNALGKVVGSHVPCYGQHLPSERLDFLLDICEAFGINTKSISALSSGNAG